MLVGFRMIYRLTTFPLFYVMQILASRAIQTIEKVSLRTNTPIAWSILNVKTENILANANMKLKLDQETFKARLKKLFRQFMLFPTCTIFYFHFSQLSSVLPTVKRLFNKEILQLN